MISCNTDRAIDDLQAAIDDMPPAAIQVVLRAWRGRINEIKDIKTYTDAREIEVLRECIKQIRAACAVEEGNGLRTLKILIGEQ
jgi:hypothetical protein